MPQFYDMGRLNAAPPNYAKQNIWLVIESEWEHTGFIGAMLVIVHNTQGIWSKYIHRYNDVKTSLRLETIVGDYF